MLTVGVVRVERRLPAERLRQIFLLARGLVQRECGALAEQGLSGIEQIGGLIGRR